MPKFLNNVELPTPDTLTLGALTQGSVLFAGAAGVVSQDNANLSWSSANKRLALTGRASFTATGTVSTTATSRTVTGSGTAFLSEVGVGDKVTVGAETMTVVAVGSDTSLTAESGFTSSNSGASMTVAPAWFLAAGPAADCYVYVNTPANLLSVVGAGNSAGLLLNGYSSGSASQSPVLSTKRARGSLASPSAVTSGDTLFRVGVSAYGATKFSGSRAAIDAKASQTWTDAANGCEWVVFNTPDGSTTLTERLRVYQDGTIGHRTEGYLSVADPLNPPYQASPIKTGLATAANYNLNTGTADNIFHLSSWVTSAGTAACVAVFGEGVTEGSSARAWGGNFVAYVNHATSSNAIGTEINFGKLVSSSGGAYGTVIASAGYYATNAHVQIQANTAHARSANAINFSNSTNDCCSGYLIKASGAGRPQGGIDFSSHSFGQGSIKLPLTGNALNSGIGAVRIVSGGDGYGTGAVTATLSGGGGSGGQMDAQVISGGTVSIATVGNVGTSYTSSPAVTVTKAGTDATGTATVSGGAVTALAVADGGTAYEPSATFAVTFTGGSGTGCTANATTNSSGVVTSFSVTAGGSGYTNGNTLTAVLASAASIQAAVGMVSGTSIVNPGAGYGSTPTVSFAGGLTAGTVPTFTVATRSGTSILTLSITNAGTALQLSSTFPVYFTGGTGTGAEAWVTTNGSGVVTAVAVTAGGTGYGAADVLTAAPAVAATAVRVGGVITGLTLTAYGGGLKTAPTISFTGGTPTTAAQAIVARGGIGIGVDPAAPLQIADDGNQWGAALALADVTQTFGTSLVLGPGNSLLGFAPTLGCYEFDNTDPWAQSNVKGDWVLLTMPSLGSTATAPTLRASCDPQGNLWSKGALLSDHGMCRHYDLVTSATTTLTTLFGVARTVTSAVAATNQKDSGGEWLRISATSNNADASLAAATFTLTQVQADPVLVSRVRVPTDLVNRRIFFGLFSGAAVMTTDTQNTIHSAYFRYSTGASDTTWKCCTSNASSTTVVDSLVTVVADTRYELRIDCTDASNIRFYVNNRLVATGVATLPTATQSLGPGHYLRSLSASGQKNLDVAYTAVYQ